jgi:hypothetical protein
MNKERVPSAKIVTALKAESLRCRARGEESNPITVVACAETSKPQTPSEDVSKLFCKFCNCTGHNLLVCNNAKRVLKQRKSERQKKWAAKKNTLSTSNKSSLKKAQESSSAQAGHTSVVEIGNFSNDSSNFEVSHAAATDTAATALLSRISGDQLDFNLDLGCLVSMTPFIADVDHLTKDSTPVCLADSTTVKATHAGRFSIPPSKLWLCQSYTSHSCRSRDFATKT